MNKLVCPKSHMHEVKRVDYSDKKEDFFHFCTTCKEDILAIKNQLESQNKEIKVSFSVQKNKKSLNDLGGFSTWNEIKKNNFLNKYPAFCNDEEFKKWSFEDQKEWYKYQINNNDNNHSGLWVDNF